MSKPIASVYVITAAPGSGLPDVYCNLKIDVVPGKDLILVNEGDAAKLHTLVDKGCVLFYTDPWAGADQGFVTEENGQYYWVSTLTNPHLQSSNILTMTGNEPSKFVIEGQTAFEGKRQIVGVIEYQFGYGIRVYFELPLNIKEVKLSPNKGTSPCEVTLEYEGSATGLQVTVMDQRVD